MRAVGPEAESRLHGYHRHPDPDVLDTLDQTPLLSRGESGLLPKW